MRVVVLAMALAAIGCGRRAYEPGQDADGGGEVDAAAAEPLAGPYYACFDFDGGEAVDISGHGRDGRCTAPECPAQAVVGGETGLLFDGVDDGLLVDYTPEQDQLTNAFTISVWLNASSEPADVKHVIAVPFGTATANSLELFARPSASGPQLRLSWDSTVDLAFDIPFESLLRFERQHVAATWDGSEACLYLGGQLVECENGVVPGVEMRDLMIGFDENNGSPDSHWQGLIDDPCLWLRALSADEVRGLATGRAVPGFGP